MENRLYLVRYGCSQELKQAERRFYDRNKNFLVSHNPLSGVAIYQVDDVETSIIVDGRDLIVRVCSPFEKFKTLLESFKSPELFGNSEWEEK